MVNYYFLIQFIETHHRNINIMIYNLQNHILIIQAVFEKIFEISANRSVLLSLTDMLIFQSSPTTHV